ncbi:nicotinate-nucleotide--dimethylbenzimidazole phosphoribosyltransferase [mine drainage metagenome]|jgi:nicotinate-nucleotide--dimethylbenzimidazole phosphoribosyltransferase|uniref:Nicotinate-nucleotide--dimethylbenzimidazole phosphoribosyltransferase n=1 Tax=mine drainage metagenome TaxID=410659 RepID=A0A1J5QY81_9ZZZZ
MEPAFLKHPVAVPDATHAAAARAHQSCLTKPPGSLGQLEALAITLAAAQGVERPHVDRPWIAVFAGDHGVVAEGVSAFPQAVTAEMIRNFARGGAAISVIARTLGAELEVVNLGTVGDVEDLPGVHQLRLARGTANLMREPAMDAALCAASLEAGRASAVRAQQAGADLYIGGEMGIGNTTAATTLAALLSGHAADQLAGPGTGLPPEGVAHKAAVVRAALALHQPHVDSAFEAMRRVGGLEIAALAGAYVACAQAGLAVLVDGFIASVAALAAERLCPGTARWFIFAHASAEPGHARVLEALDARPILDLGMRLGEASGAGVAVPVLRMACALHAGMATFEQASVSGRL